MTEALARGDWHQAARVAVGARRTLVLGPPGSGKTTLTLRLAAAASLDALHLDAHFWQSGWIATPDDLWRERVTALAARPAWVMDGTYERSLPLRLPRADLVIVVHADRARSLWGVVSRRLLVRGGRVDAPTGQRLDRAFLRYIVRYPSRTAPVVERAIEAHGRHATRIDLRSRRELHEFTRALDGFQGAAVGARAR